MSDVATITADAATTQTWDAIVIGAGPAGALAAHQLAMSHSRTLLVERKPFPRYKVCGACVNRRAIKTLALAGLGDVIPALPTQPLHQLRMYHGRLSTSLPLKGSVSVSRSSFDLELVRRAIDAGSHFLDETSATVEAAETSKPYRYVRLHSVDGNESIAETCVILVADGIAGGSLRNCGVSTKVREHSRVGFGGIIDVAGEGYGANAVHMAIHSRAYVGLVKVAPQRLNIAGAADADFLRECGSPAACARAVIESTALPSIANVQTGHATWTGTPPLTRRRTRAAAHRLLLLGDAAGYVEPFTGEGIAWALTSACQVADLAVAGMTDWTPTIEFRWQKLRDADAARHQRTCRAVARVLRHPTLIRLSMQAVAAFPGLATPFLNRINEPTI